MTRLQVAAQILAGICAGDWKLDIPEGSTWDDVAIPRALELADKLMGYQTEAQFNLKEYTVTLGEKND